MLYIFCALYAEASDIIAEYDLKKQKLSLKFDVFENIDKKIRLTLTGVGQISAATAVGSICTYYEIGKADYILNIGTCCGVDKPGTVYLINKLINENTGRTYYPDMLLKSSLKEACDVTGAMVANAPKQANEKDFLQSPIVYDMEAASIYEAASFFVAPSQLSFIKVISDNDGAKLTAKDVAGIMKNALPTLKDYIDTICKYLGQADFDQTILLDNDIEKWAQDMRCSVTMEKQLLQLLKFASLAGIDYNSMLRDYYERQILPTRDKKVGKQVLDELTDKIL